MADKKNEIVDTTLDGTTNSGLHLGGGPGHYSFTDGHAAAPLKDLKLENVTFGGLVEFVKKRTDQVKLNLPTAHLRVDEEKMTIQFTLHEHGGKNSVGQDYEPAVNIGASTGKSVDLQDVQKIIATDWSASDLADKVRKMLHVFPGRAEYDRVFEALRTMEFNITTHTKEVKADTGQLDLRLKQEVKNAQMLAFNFRVPYFKGSDPVDIPVRVIYTPTGNGVKINLFCAEMTSIERAESKALLERTTTEINTLFEGKLPVIYVN